MKYSTQFGRNVARFMRQKHLSVSLLSLKTNLSKHDIEKILQGQYLLLPKDVMALASALDTTPTNLLSDNKSCIY